MHFKSLFVFAVAGAVLSPSLASNPSALAKAFDGSSTTNITLNHSENKPSDSSGTFLVSEPQDRHFEFTYSGFIPTSDGWGALSNGGYLTNLYRNSASHNAIKGLTSIQVNCDNQEGLRVGYGLYHANEHNEKLPSNGLYSFNESSPSYFKIENMSGYAITINSIILTYNGNEKSPDLTEDEVSSYEIKVDGLNENSIREAYTHAKSLTRSQLGESTSIRLSLPGGSLCLENGLSFPKGIAKNNNAKIRFVGNETTLFGGREITRGGWAQHGNGIYKKQLTNINRFSNLIVNGEIAKLAQSDVIKGEYDDKHSKFKYITEKLEINGNIGTSPDNPLLLITEERWAQNIGIVTDISYEKKIFHRKRTVLCLSEYTKNTFFDKTRVYKDSEPHFFLANHLSLLNEPNEWFYDSVNETLYYKPLNPSAINSMSFVVSSAKTIIDTGDLGDNISFENITFNGSDYISTMVDGYNELQATISSNVKTKEINYLPGIIEINSNCVAIEDCVIKNSGGNGIVINKKSEHITIKDNRILNNYGCGIFVGKSGYYSDEISSNIRIIFNTVDGFGLFYKGGIGIAALYVNKLDISHNTVCNGSYSGISVGWGWCLNPLNALHRQYTVNYNKIYNVVHSALYDGAPIYALGGFPNSKGEIFNEIAHNYLERQRGLSAIYLDEASSSWNVHDNVCNILNNEGNFKGAIFVHNTMYKNNPNSTSCHSLYFHNNYSNLANSYKDEFYIPEGGETPEFPKGLMSASQKAAEIEASCIRTENPIQSTSMHINEEIYSAAGSRMGNPDDLGLTISNGTGSLELIEAKREDFFYKAKDLHYGWTRINFANTSLFYDKGYRSISLKVEKNVHNMYVFYEDDLKYDNRIPKGGGKVNVPLRQNATLVLMTCHEYMTGDGIIQDETGQYGTSENISVRYHFSKEVCARPIEGFDIRNHTMATFGNDFANNSGHFSANGSIQFKNSFFSFMKEKGYRSFKFSVAPNAESGCRSIVSVIAHYLNNVSYPAAYQIDNDGIIHVSFTIPNEAFFATTENMIFVFRDEKGYEGTENKILSGARFFGFEFEAAISTDSGSLRLDKSTADSMVYYAKDVSYDWRRIRIENTSSLYSQGYRKISISIKGNKHNIYVFYGEEANYDNRISVGGGSVTLELQDGEGLTIMTSHECYVGEAIVQDDEGEHGKEENFQLSLDLARNDYLNIFANFLGSKLENDGTFSVPNGFWTLPALFFEHLKTIGYKSFTFSIKPNDESECESIVTVKHTKEGKVEYPHAFMIDPGTNKITISISVNDLNEWDKYGSLDFVCRNEHGYNGAAGGNKPLHRAVLDGISFAK